MTRDAFDDNISGPSDFDELEAVRRFPSEDQWLDLPLPAGMPAPDPQPAGFTERALRAIRDQQKSDRELDGQLSNLEHSLPNETLQAFVVPATSADFVVRTLAALRQDRSARWQHLLARYVAPEPSPQFVNRTLAALHSDEDAPASAARPRRTDHRAAGRFLRRGFWPLLAVAATAALWLLLDSNSQAAAPLELRLARQSSPATARAYTATPMSAILASLAHDAEPDALIRDPADGVWLLLAGE